MNIWRRRASILWTRIRIKHLVGRYFDCLARNDMQTARQLRARHGHSDLFNKRADVLDKIRAHICS